MARSVYFSHGTQNEINLYEDIIIESLKIYGHDMLYIPRDIVKLDSILNEDIQSEFNDAYSIEMYPTNVEGFEGEGSIMSKFGLEIRDAATFIVAKKSWEKFVGIQNNLVDSNRPREGDLIYFPLSKSLFEIKFTEHEKPFYQIQDLPIYELSVELFEYSGEDLNTGVAEIDEIQTFNDFAVTFTTGPELTSPVILPLKTKIYQWVDTDETIKVTGEISLYEYDTAQFEGLVSITNIGTSDGEFHLFAEGKPIFIEGDTTELFNLVEENKLDDINDNADRNDVFEIEATDILDWSEKNPFGEL